MENKPLVVITGVSGYIGSHVAHKVLQNGGFRVRGTMRSIKPEKTDPLKAAFGDDLFANIEFVEADLLNDESMDKAIEGATYVIHVASPITGNFDGTDRKVTIIKPAVDGTMSAMRACEKHGVKRIVITSSIVACSTGHSDKLNFTVEDWSKTEDDNKDVSDYSRSKHFAEKAAWDFVKNLPEDKKVECVTILPGLVVGPQLIQCAFASGNIMKMFWKGNPSQWAIGLIDVRDVAEAHLQAILKPEANGQRFMLVNETFFTSEVNTWIYTRHGKNFPAMTASTEEPDLSKKKIWDNTSTKNVLGIKFIDIKTSVEEMSDMMVKNKYVE